jgi:hypothetical protein
MPLSAVPVVRETPLPYEARIVGSAPVTGRETSDAPGRVAPKEFTPHSDELNHLVRPRRVRHLRYPVTRHRYEHDSPNQIT